jgi:Domain of unknown function (DUF4382)
MSFPSKFAHPGTFPVTPFLICAVLLVNVAGCNACFVGVSNPINNSPTVTTVNGNPLPACLPLPPPTIAVKAVAHLVQACADCSASLQVTHVHLLLSGMELHPGADADENSPEWQELAPDWVRQPQWLDLLDDPLSNDVAVPLNVTGQIPAGTYYQLRLRLAQPSSQHVGELSAESHCSLAGASCVVTADGSFQSLQTFDGHPYIRVEATFPIDLRTDQSNLLRIELRPEWAPQILPTGVLDEMPLLRGHVVVESSSATNSF